MLLKENPILTVIMMKYVLLYIDNFHGNMDIQHRYCANFVKDSKIKSMTLPFYDLQIITEKLNNVKICIIPEKTHCELEVNREGSSVLNFVRGFLSPLPLTFQLLNLQTFKEMKSKTALIQDQVIKSDKSSITLNLQGFLSFLSLNIMPPRHAAS